MGIIGVIIIVGLVAYGMNSRNNDDTSGENESGGGLITVDGSSTVYPITEAVAEDFQGAQPGTNVTVGISGTGGGFKKFCAGETDVANASRPIKASEIQACEEQGISFVELPVAFDGIAVMVNPNNTWVDRLTTEELKKIWEPAAQGTITKWSDVRAEWPDSEIHLFGPGADSGTFDYFTEAIVGEEDSSRGDFTASEDDNVLVQGIANDELALGFFGVAYYEENKDKLKLVPIDDGDDTNGAGAVLPEYDAIAQGMYQPLSRPIFIYVSTTAAQRSEVDAFVQYYLENAPELTREVGYIALPGNAYTSALQKFANRVTDSVFAGGSEIGVSIDNLVKSE